MQMLPYLLPLLIFKPIALFTMTCMFRQWKQGLMQTILSLCKSYSIFVLFGTRAPPALRQSLWLYLQWFIKNWFFQPTEVTITNRLNSIANILLYVYLNSAAYLSWNDCHLSMHKHWKVLYWPADVTYLYFQVLI